MVEIKSICYIIKRNNQPYKEIEKCFPLLLNYKQNYDFMTNFIYENLLLFERLDKLIEKESIDDIEWIDYNLLIKTNLKKAIERLSIYSNDHNIQPIIKSFYRYWFNLMEPYEIGGYNIEKIKTEIDKNIQACRGFLIGLHRYNMITKLPIDFNH